ncbi:hypothetical protein N9772_07175 [Bacteroidia bacterium]|nr:hypothetical protein [Bacteroidia bacterium]
MEHIQNVTGDNGQTKKRNSELKFNYSATVNNTLIADVIHIQKLKDFTRISQELSNT